MTPLTVVSPLAGPHVANALPAPERVVLTPPHPHPPVGLATASEVLLPVTAAAPARVATDVVVPRATDVAVVERAAATAVAAPPLRPTAPWRTRFARRASSARTPTAAANPTAATTARSLLSRRFALVARPCPSRALAHPANCVLCV